MFAAFKAILLTLLFLATPVFADNVKLKYKEKAATITTHDIKVNQVQAKLRCVFMHKKSGGFLVRERLPFTHITNSSRELFDLHVKKSSLTEWLPGFKLKSCAFILIVLGEDKDGHSRLGDIPLLGKLSGFMSKQELDFMQDKVEANSYLNKKLETLQLAMGLVRGKKRIIALP